MEDYIDLIRNDVDAAIAKHNRLPTNERAEILLYLLDNVRDVTDASYKKFFLNSEALMKCIKIANKNVRGDDKALIEMAVDLYNKGSINTIPEVKEIEPEKIEVVRNNYYHLIKQK